MKAIFKNGQRSPRVSRFTFHVLRSTLHASPPVPRSSRAFTLLELLVVIAIIAIIAAMSGPVLRNFSPNITASATRQLLDDLGRARQLAISQHTTVYVIFLPPAQPTTLWNDPARVRWTLPDWQKMTNIADKQMVGYTFVSLHSMGDQPGRPTRRYLTSWRSLPEGTYIPPFKFLPNNVLTFITTNNLGGVVSTAFQVPGFDTTVSVPFPAADTPTYRQNQPYVQLPYVAFDYLGRLYREGQSVPPSFAFIPLAKGSVGFSRDTSKMPTLNPPSVNEKPPGNSTNAYNVVVIEGITGRARLEHL